MRTALVLAVRAGPGGRSRARWCRSAGRSGAGERLPRRAPEAGPALRPGRAVRRLHLALVLRDLPAAVRLAGRLHHPAGRGVRPGAAGPAAPDAAQPGPAARVRDRGSGWAGRLRRGCSAGPASCCGSGATGSMSPTTSVAAERGYLREAGNLVFHISLLFLLLGVGDRQALRLPRHQRGDRRAGLRQQPDPVRRLQLRRRGSPSADLAPFSLTVELLRGEVRDRRRCSAGRLGCSGPTSR